MGKYLVELWLDGYDNEEDREKAELAFIEEQLDFSASSVKVTKVSDAQAAAIQTTSNAVM